MARSVPMAKSSAWFSSIFLNHFEGEKGESKSVGHGTRVREAEATHDPHGGNAEHASSSDGDVGPDQVGVLERRRDDLDEGGREGGLEEHEGVDERLKTTMAERRRGSVCRSEDVTVVWIKRRTFIR